jgi:hypothetical protein
MPGIQAVCNKHSCVMEKRDAFDKLAALITSTANPGPAGNVVAIGDDRRRRAR